MLSNSGLGLHLEKFMLVVISYDDNENWHIVTNMTRGGDEVWWS